MEVVLVALGGALGASLRYGAGQLLTARSPATATLFVNVLGSFILGLVVFGTADHRLTLFFGVGMCGAFTTFSSFSYQTLELWEGGRAPEALFYATANLLISIGAYGLAWILMGERIRFIQFIV